MNDEDSHHRRTNTANEKPVGPIIVLIGYALLPLLLSILFVVFFLASGKIHT